MCLDFFLAQHATIAPQFPPRQTTSIVSILFHVGLLLLVIAAIASLFITTQRRTRLLDLLIWPVIVAATITLAILYKGPDGTLAFIAGYVMFVVMISVSGFVLGLVRVCSKSVRKSRAAYVIFSLVALWLLILMLLPATPAVREAARRTDCKNQMKQIAIAMHDWNDEFGRLPDLAITDGDDPPRTWRVDLLSFIESDHVRKKYRKDRRWDETENLPSAKTYMPHYRCPSVHHERNHRDESGRYFTHYLAVTGPNTIFANGKGMKLADVSSGDGTSKTLLLVEASGRNVVWTEPRDADTSMQPMEINLAGLSIYDSPGMLSTYHPAGVNLSMADASVHTVPRRIDPKILQALTTTNGNDPADRGF